MDRCLANRRLCLCIFCPPSSLRGPLATQCPAECAAIHDPVTHGADVDNPYFYKCVGGLCTHLSAACICTSCYDRHFGIYSCDTVYIRDMGFRGELYVGWGYSAYLGRNSRVSYSFFIIATYPKCRDKTMPYFVQSLHLVRTHINPVHSYPSHDRS